MSILIKSRNFKTLLKEIMQLLWAVDTYLLKNVGYEIENGTNSSQEFDWISTLQFKQMMTIS